jgi:hypothetical protein
LNFGYDTGRATTDIGYKVVTLCSRPGTQSRFVAAEGAHVMLNGFGDREVIE